MNTPRVPPLIDGDDELTVFAAAVIRRYASAVVAGDQITRRRLRAQWASDPAWFPLEALANDIDASPGLAAMEVEAR